MGNIVLYQSEDGEVSLDVNVQSETVWLTQDQMTVLFGRNKSTISRHIRNVFEEGELDKAAVVANFATTAADGKTYQVEHYNLDVIISVGYRVKSQRGVQFRRWATGVLRRYILDGYAVNQKRLQQLEQVVRVLARSNDEIASGVADVVSRYLPGLELLRDYDAKELEPKPAAKPSWELTLERARAIIADLRASFPNDTMLGFERDDGLERIIGAIYQGFGGRDIYPTVEEKAAHLLYFVVKDHPLADGNKRSAAALFVSFLAENGGGFADGGAPRITNNGLAAITLFVANSNPDEKDLMIDLVMRMLSGKWGHE